MFVLILTTLLSSMILGDQQYNLNITNPKTVVRQRDNEQQPYKDKKITFSLNSNKIDFGTLRPTVPVLRENIMKITSAGWGFSILAFEDHPLRSGSNAIPDTTCDNGTCSDNLKSSWDNPLVFGFGVSTDNKYYGQLANQEESESKRVLKIGNTESEFKINYKLNVPSTQLSGIYSNTVTYILVPDY